MRLRGADSGRVASGPKRLELVGLTDPFDLEVHFGDRGRGARSERRREVAPAAPDRWRPVDHEGDAPRRAGRPGRVPPDRRGGRFRGRTPLAIPRDRDLPDEPAMRALARYGLTDCAERHVETHVGRAASPPPGAHPRAGRRQPAAARRADRQPRPRARPRRSRALDEFEGTVLAVTHDRWFMRGFDRYLLLNDDCTVVEALDLDAARHSRTQVQSQAKQLLGRRRRLGRLRPRDQAGEEEDDTGDPDEVRPTPAAGSRESSWLPTSRMSTIARRSPHPEGEQRQAQHDARTPAISSETDQQGDDREADHDLAVDAGLPAGDGPDVGPHPLGERSDDEEDGAEEGEQPTETLLFFWRGAGPRGPSRRCPATPGRGVAAARGCCQLWGRGGGAGGGGRPRLRAGARSGFPLGRCPAGAPRRRCGAGLRPAELRGGATAAWRARGPVPRGPRPRRRAEPAPRARSSGQLVQGALGTRSPRPGSLGSPILRMLYSLGGEALAQRVLGGRTGGGSRGRRPSTRRPTCRSRRRAGGRRPRR